MDKFTTDLQDTETYLTKKNLEFEAKQKFPFDDIVVSFDDTLLIFTIVVKRIGSGIKKMEMTKEVAENQIDVHDRLCFLETLPFG